VKPITKKEKIMNRLTWLCLTGIVFFCLPQAGNAGDFDGSKPMLCATIQAIECSPDSGCTEVSLESAGLPRFAVIDILKKVIYPTKECGMNRVSTIERMETVDGKLILQGAEDGIEGVRDGLGWTIAVAEESGELVLTASGDDVAFVVFGACTIQQSN
jgi:hypothetical protein